MQIQLNGLCFVIAVACWPGLSLGVVFWHSFAIRYLVANETKVSRIAKRELAGLVELVGTPAPYGARLAYSTVTLLARFLGLSTSQPRRTAMW